MCLKRMQQTLLFCPFGGWACPLHRAVPVTSTFPFCCRGENQNRKRVLICACTTTNKRWGHITCSDQRSKRSSSRSKVVSRSPTWYTSVAGLQVRFQVMQTGLNRVQVRVGNGELAFVSTCSTESEGVRSLFIFSRQGSFEKRNPTWGRENLQCVCVYVCVSDVLTDVPTNLNMGDFVQVLDTKHAAKKETLNDKSGSTQVAEKWTWIPRVFFECPLR